MLLSGLKVPGTKEICDSCLSTVDFLVHDVWCQWQINGALLYFILGRANINRCLKKKSLFSGFFCDEATFWFMSSEGLSSWWPSLKLLNKRTNSPCKSEKKVVTLCFLAKDTGIKPGWSKQDYTIYIFVRGNAFIVTRRMKRENKFLHHKWKQSEFYLLVLIVGHHDTFQVSKNDFKH